MTAALIIVVGVIFIGWIGAMAFCSIVAQSNEQQANDQEDR